MHAIFDLLLSTLDLLDVLWEELKSIKFRILFPRPLYLNYPRPCLSLPHILHSYHRIRENYNRKHVTSTPKKIKIEAHEADLAHLILTLLASLSPDYHGKIRILKCRIYLKFPLLSDHLSHLHQIYLDCSLLYRQKALETTSKLQP
jgi:hypothetical protein